MRDIAFAVADGARGLAVVLANAEISAAMAIHRSAAIAVRTRRELMQVKSLLGHGKFLPWIEAEF
jgi:hypothetical protein